MICQHCGSTIEHPSKFCPECGKILTETEKSSTIAVKKKMPFWFKAVTTFAVLALIGVTAGILFTERLVDVVEHHLEAIREGHVEEAYKNYTSKEFQSTTSFEQFSHFIETYPVFLNNQSSLFTERSLQHHIGILRGKLNSSQKEITPIEYRVIKEGKRWKILSIRLLKPQEISSPKEGVKATDLIEIVQNQLNDLHENKFKEAYEKYSSTYFKEGTPFENFMEFIRRYPVMQLEGTPSFLKPTIQQGIGAVSVVMKEKDSLTHVKYYFIYENHEWKIWSIRVLPSYSSKKERRNKSGVLNHPMELGQITIGTSIDSFGLIKNPTLLFSQDLHDLYVDIQVKEGIKDLVVRLSLKHLESHTVIPSKAVIEKNGTSFLMSVFSAPPQGWPKGHYQLNVSASPEVSRSIDFEIQ